MSKLLDSTSEVLSQPLRELLKYLEKFDYKFLFSDRKPTDSYIYDGESITLLRSVYPWVDPWNSLFDNLAMRFASDHEILHEIVHGVCTSNSDQRYFPEWGLKIGVVERYAVGTCNDGFREKIGELWTIKNEEQLINIIEDKEQVYQEYTTQLLGVFFGRKFCIPCTLPKLHFLTWDSFEAAAIYHSSVSGLYSEVKNRFEILKQKFV